MARKTKSRTRKRKQVPWAGWGKIAPKGRERTEMKKRCGKKCFLGPDKSFPVCAKGTCRVSAKGAYAAYIRAREWGKSARSYKGLARPTMKRSVYTQVARKAKRILRNKGYKVGKSDRRRSSGRSYRSRSSRRRSSTRRSRTRRGGKCGSCASSCGRCSRRRTSRGGMRKCPKGTRHRLLGQTRHGRRIRKHGHYSRKCSKKRSRSRSRSRSRRR